MHVSKGRSIHTVLSRSDSKSDGYASAKALRIPCRATFRNRHGTRGDTSWTPYHAAETKPEGWLFAQGHKEREGVAYLMRLLMPLTYAAPNARRITPSKNRIHGNLFFPATNSLGSLTPPGSKGGRVRVGGAFHQNASDQTEGLNSPQGSTLFDSLKPQGSRRKLQRKHVPMRDIRLRTW